MHRTETEHTAALLPSNLHARAHTIATDIGSVDAVDIKVAERLSLRGRLTL